MDSNALDEVPAGCDRDPAALMSTLRRLYRSGRTPRQALGLVAGKISSDLAFASASGCSQCSTTPEVAS